jgi:hypothetical protein
VKKSDDERVIEAAMAFASKELGTYPLPTREEQRALEAALPESDPAAPIMVSRSIRLPARMEADIKAAAAKDGVTPSEWMRRVLRDALRPMAA